MAEKKTLARPYAKAAFEFACENNNLNDWSAMLQNAAAMTKDDRVRKIINNPALTAGQRSAFFTEQKKVFNKQFCNFISLTAIYDRLDLLPQISDGYEDFKHRHNKEVKVDVTSAAEIKANQRTELEGVLAKKLNKSLNVNYNIDQNLIGGLVIRMGDFVIDSSVNGQLKKMLGTLLY